MYKATLTVIICLSLAVHLYTIACDKNDLATLLKYTLSEIFYLIFLVKERLLLDGDFIGAIWLASVAIFLVVKMASFANNTFLIYNFVKEYFIINQDSPRISYKLFKQMYILHPEKFHLSAYSWKYRTEKFSLNFFGYVCARFMLERNVHKTENMKYRENRFQDNQKLITVMQQDLEKDLITVQKKKESAHKEICDAATEYQNLVSSFKFN